MNNILNNIKLLLEHLLNFSQSFEFNIKITVIYKQLGMESIN